MPGFWRKCRIAFRWARYACWLLVVLALLALAWVNVVGVPDFFRTRLVAALREQGFQLELSRVRWRFIHGIVADNVIIGDRTNRVTHPLFTAGQIQLRLDYAALAKKQFHLAGIVVRDGIFTLPVSPTNRLALLNIQAEVRFLPDETWSLDELRADFSGMKIRFAGQIVHAPELKNWDVFAAKKPGGGGVLTRPLQDFADTLVKIRFARPPQISAQIFGDARNEHSFTLRLNADAPQISTPWFAARGWQFAANISAPDAVTNFSDTLDFWTNALPFRLAWTTRTAELDLNNFDARAVEIAGDWAAPQLSVAKFNALFGGGKLNAAARLDVQTRELAFTNDSAFNPHALESFLPPGARARLQDVAWTQPPALAVSGLCTVPAWTNRMTDWREFISPATRLHGTLASTNAVVGGQTVELARLHFDFANELWALRDVQLVQGRTQLALDAEASAATKNFRATLRGNLAAETVQPFLPTNVSEPLFRLVKLGEPVALDLMAAGSLDKFDPLTATGRVAVTNFSIREQAYESVAADFFYTNRVLNFSQPQALRAHGTQVLTADAVALDWNAGMYFFTNGFSTTEPTAVLRAIGPKTAALIEPYEFLAPPTVRLNGQLPLRDLSRGRDLEGTDMRFEIIRPATFRWTKLSTTNITGRVFWLGQELVLTNIAADFYGGSAAGYAFFDFRPVGYGCDFDFGVDATNVDVHLLALDLATNKSNLIEGRLTGSVAVTNSNSRSWRGWNGYGTAQLHDGVLWNIPIFGFASPVLNTVTPGLGNSRATDASVIFVMTNGVARSTALEIHTLTMRLQYDGTVDLQQNVDARVTAQLLRNTPLLGSVVSTVLWPVSKIFECQVNGQVSDPKVTPIYFPFSKYLLIPLHPIRSLEEILPAAEKPKG